MVHFPITPSVHLCETQRRGHPLLQLQAGLEPAQAPLWWPQATNNPSSTCTSSLGTFHFVLQTSEFYKIQTQAQSRFEPTTSELQTRHLSAWATGSDWHTVSLSHFTLLNLNTRKKKINKDSNPRSQTFILQNEPSATKLLFKCENMTKFKYVVSHHSRVKLWDDLHETWSLHHVIVQSIFVNFTMHNKSHRMTLTADWAGLIQSPWLLHLQRAASPSWAAPGDRGEEKKQGQGFCMWSGMRGLTCST